MVGGGIYLPTPLKNVTNPSVGMMIPNWMEGHEIHVLNHQPLRVVPFLEVTSPCFFVVSLDSPISFSFTSLFEYRSVKISPRNNWMVSGFLGILKS